MYKTERIWDNDTLAFRLSNCIKLYFFQKTWKQFFVSPVNLGRVGLPETQAFYIIQLLTYVECYWTVNVILTDAERRSIWLSLLFNNTPCLPKHKTTIVLLYNKCMLCISCHFRPLNIDVMDGSCEITWRSVSQSILYNYWLMRHWIWCDIDQIIPILTEAKPRSILVYSGRYHIISNASLVNNCFII